MRLATAGIGTRNWASYSLLTGLGYRPVRQHFLMRCDEMPRPPRFEAASVEMAKPEHADATLEIYAACGFERRNRKAMSDTLADGRHAHSVVIQDGAIVAFAELETHWPRRVWVSYVGVTQAARDKGLQTALVTWSVRRQFDAGSNSALLLLSPANRTARCASTKRAASDGTA